MDQISILFVGDFCALRPENIKIGNKLHKLIKDSTAKCINFEGPLQKGEKTIANKTFLRQSDNCPKWLINHGFNIVSVANNHMYDYGVTGLSTTLNSFSSITTIGAGNWDNAYKVTYVKIGSFKVAFFSATAADLASLKDDFTDHDKLGCAWINHRNVNRIISSAKKHCDYLFVIAHAGVEHMTVPLPEWRARYKELIDCGADVVIASHPHVPQGWERYNDKLIFYSLGNFYFDKIFSMRSIPDFWDNGLAIRIILERNKPIKFEPYFTLRTGNCIEVDNRENSERLQNKLLFSLEEPNYTIEVNKQCLELYNLYLNRILIGLNAVEIGRFLPTIKNLLRAIIKGKRNNRLVLHQIRNEDNQWVVARALKLLSNTDL